jgi:hypothetical protein
MFLSADLFEQTLKSLRTSTRTIHDRRRYPRVGLRAKARIIPLDDYRQPIEPCVVTVRNISEGGVGLTSGAKLSAKQLFLLSLDRKKRQPLMLLCQVVNREATDQIGARILGKLNPSADDGQEQAETAIKDASQAMAELEKAASHAA